MKLRQPLQMGWDRKVKLVTSPGAAFRDHHVSEYHFAGSTGYGYNDSGRETIESICRSWREAALVRPQLVSEPT